MIRSLCLILLWPSALSAQVLTLPGNAAIEVEENVTLDSYPLPTGAWDGTTVPTRTIEGAMTRQVWRVAASGLASLQLMRPLREQLRTAGYEVIFECDTLDCGGFDFRFGTPIAPAPAMQVDLNDYRFLSAIQQGADGPRAVSLMVSRTPQAGFVQIIRVVPTGTDAPALTAADAPTARAAAPAPTGDLAQALTDTGHALLDGVAFETGAVALMDTDMPDLRALADYMAQNPDQTISIVGHTDSSGGLDGNIAISKRRAAAVIERLVADYGAPRARLTPAGMGYLAPIASNLTPEGREANRRVEAVVTGPID
ncbi:OmpA family protein [Loktanella salsilacus]|jgi:outer membrane protein OmpA-like peptidoglycan-associated protein|uniref:OmpA family protein n=1 Tax=Loktanella salsilacus TaxID=195913 RepID=UPI0020B86B9F|nr:OmpA family protein [Loktanella salsilacus]UTH43821.1 OmpA family protein [Loktanella salsilacus]